MSTTLARIALAGGLMLGALASGESGALAMPAFDRGVAGAATTAQGVEHARWVCGPYRCWWRPGWGWHRWHRWHAGIIGTAGTLGIIGTTGATAGDKHLFKSPGFAAGLF